VTVDEYGRVSSATVETSGGTAFDVAALVAVQQWIFEPARRGDKASAARISVPIVFEQPHDVNEQPEAAAPVGDVKATPSSRPTSNNSGVSERMPADSAPASAGSEPAPTAETTTEVVVEGESRPGSELRSASDYVLDDDILHAAPHHEGVDMLRATPGLYIGRPEGPAVAHR